MSRRPLKMVFVRLWLQKKAKYHGRCLQSPLGKKKKKKKKTPTLCLLAPTQPQTNNFSNCTGAIVFLSSRNNCVYKWLLESGASDKDPQSDEEWQPRNSCLFLWFSIQRCLVSSAHKTSNWYFSTLSKKAHLNKSTSELNWFQQWNIEVSSTYGHTLMQCNYNQNGNEHFKQKNLT